VVCGPVPRAATPRLFEVPLVTYSASCPPLRAKGRKSRHPRDLGAVRPARYGGPGRPSADDLPNKAVSGGALGPSAVGWRPALTDAVIVIQRVVILGGGTAGTLAANRLQRELGGQAAITVVDRALALNPSFERGWRASAWLRLYAGQPDVAVEHIQTAIRLSPRFGNTTDIVLIGCAHFFQRRFEDAISAYLTAREQMPKNPAIPRYLAACYAQAGRLEQAGQMLEQLRTITPVVMPSTVPFRNPEHRNLYLSGLRLAAGDIT